MTKAFNQDYLPVYAITRGNTLESIHHGAVSIVDANGNLIAWYGNPDTVTFLRSTAKPFQALSLLERGGHTIYNLTPREIAIICSSHSGTEEHVSVIKSLQEKVGMKESDLLCGKHYPFHEPTASAMRLRGEEPTPIQHNCSGKHSGMLALASIYNQPVENIDYIDPNHPIQQEILTVFAKLCSIEKENVALGIDGCSAPNFAVPLKNCALGFARLCDPQRGKDLSPELIAGCRLITSSITANPELVAGEGRFDTVLMEVGGGRIVSKGGAEGFQGVGLMPGVLSPDSPGIGIALKIADGDVRRKVRSAVTIEILHQLGLLSENELKKLAIFGPKKPIHNWQRLHVGQSYPILELNYAG